MALTPEAKQILRQAKALKTLSEYPEWKVFLEIISGQCDNWGALAVSQSKSMDELVAAEYPKGVLFGLRLAAGLPSATYVQREDILQRNAHDPDVQAEQNDPAETSSIPTAKAP